MPKIAAASMTLKTRRSSTCSVMLVIGCSTSRTRRRLRSVLTEIRRAGPGLDTRTSSFSMQVQGPHTASNRMPADLSHRYGPPRALPRPRIRDLPALLLAPRPKRLGRGRVHPYGDVVELGVEQPGVHVQRHRRGRVPEHPLDGLDVRPR